MNAAIAIPVWAYLLLFAVVVLALLAGMWIGYGRGWDHCEEDQHYERLQAKNSGHHPAGKGRHRTGADMPGVLLKLPPREAAVVAFESWDAHTEQALAVISEPATELQLVAAAPDLRETDSAFTRRMAVETDELIKSIEERSNYWRHLIQDKS